MFSGLHYDLFLIPLDKKLWKKSWTFYLVVITSVNYLRIFSRSVNFLKNPEVWNCDRRSPTLLSELYHNLFLRFRLTKSYEKIYERSRRIIYEFLVATLILKKKSETLCEGKTALVSPETIIIGQGAKSIDRLNANTGIAIKNKFSLYLSITVINSREVFPLSSHRKPQFLHKRASHTFRGHT